MATPPFDAAKALSFDLARGLIGSGGAVTSVLVPLDALGQLCLAAGPQATATFASAVGDVIGAGVRRRLQAAGTDPRAASIDLVLEQLAGQWATLGWGSLTIERWGRALVFVADHTGQGPTHDERLAAVLAAALSAASGTSCRCVPLVRQGEQVRLLVTGAGAATRALGWLGQGISWGEVLVRLHGVAQHEGER